MSESRTLEGGSRDFCFSDVSIGSYPWCGGHSGNATSLLPYDHGRLAHDETPYSFLFYFLLYSTSYLYIEDGSTLLKSRDGGRSLNISIEENMLLFLFKEISLKMKIFL